MQKRNLIHLTHSVSRMGGGLFASVRHLSQYTQKVSKADITVVALEDVESQRDVGCWAPLIVKTHRVLGPKSFGYAPFMLQDLCSADADMIHLHGLWRYPSLAALRWARRTRRPYIISPHGMMEPWALKQSRLRKAIANTLYHRACVQGASVLRATSAMEMMSIRKAGYSNPVAVIPNGVEFPTKMPARKPRLPGTPKRALFLSRIHPKKGLLNLVEAWGRLQPQDWELHIMGPDEGGHQAEVEAAVRKRSLQTSIKFLGEVWGEEARTQIYRDADLFVLPTHSENFGLVIAEALVCEVPVITTLGAPWEELNSRHCGWWIEIGVEPLVVALKHAFTTPEADRREMGIRGRNLIQSRYGWEQIGKQMVETYRWMLGERPKPEFVFYNG